MKNPLLFTLCGGLILFVWQFISFAALNLHGSASSYTPLQDPILNQLKELELPQGMYALGTLPQEDYADPEKVEAYLAEQNGQPWGILQYHHSWQSDMTSNLLRGFTISLLVAFGMFWILRQLPSSNLIKRILICAVIGLIGFFFHPYSQFIWFKFPDVWAHLLDSILPFALLGLLTVRWNK
ncbi:MAG: hypothetical protein ACO3MV_06685 [Flavobacteriales bacterium]